MFKAYQENDRGLQRLIASAEHQNSKRFIVRAVEGVGLIHDGNQIFIPGALRDRVLNWYHQMLVHPGEKRTGCVVHLAWTKGGCKTSLQAMSYVSDVLKEWLQEIWPAPCERGRMCQME